MTAIQHVDKCTRQAAECTFRIGVQYTEEELEIREEQMSVSCVISVVSVYVF